MYGRSVSEEEYRRHRGLTFQSFSIVSSGVGQRWRVPNFKGACRPYFVEGGSASAKELQKELPSTALYLLKQYFSSPGSSWAL